MRVTDAGLVIIHLVEFTQAVLASNFPFTMGYETVFSLLSAYGIVLECVLFRVLRHRPVMHESLFHIIKSSEWRKASAGALFGRRIGEWRFRQMCGMIRLD